MMNATLTCQVMVIPGASHLKPLRSREAPVLHHAQAKAVVDMREDSASHGSATSSVHSTQEIHLTVDQLLRDSRKSLHIAAHSQVLAGTLIVHVCRATRWLHLHTVNMVFIELQLKRIWKQFPCQHIWGTPFVVLCCKAWCGTELDPEPDTTGTGIF